MKGGLAAMVYGAHLLHQAQLPKEGQVVVACVVQEEPCEGLASRVLVEEEGVRPLQQAVYASVDRPADWRTQLTWVSDPNPQRRPQIEAFNRRHPDCFLRLIPADLSGMNVQRNVVQACSGVGAAILDVWGIHELQMYVNAGILLKLGAYGLIRFNLTLFPEASVDLVPVLAVLAVVGIIYGAVVAIAQSDIKRLVAYSSVSHLGFVVQGSSPSPPRGSRAGCCRWSTTA